MRGYELSPEQDLDKIVILPAEGKPKQTAVEIVRNHVIIDELLRSRGIITTIVLPAEEKHPKKST